MQIPKNYDHLAYAFTDEEKAKLPTLYIAFSAATSKTVRPYRDNMPAPPQNWREIMNYSYAEGFRKAADIE